MPSRRRGCAPTARRVSSLCAGAERRARIEIGLALDEPARNVRLAARVDDEVESLVRRIRNRDEHDVRLCLGENARRFVGAAEHGYSLQAAAPQAWIVVDEADDALARCFAELPHQAAAAPACADDQRPPSRSAVAQRRESTV